MFDESVFYRKAKPERRVVVTGLGCVSPLGNDMPSTWDNVLRGQSGIQNITQFDATDFDSQIAGEVRNFDISDFLGKKDTKRTERFCQLAIAATKEAIERSGLEISTEIAETTGVFIGVGLGGLPLIEKTHQTLVDRGPGRVSPFFVPMAIPNMAAGQVAMRFGLLGPNYAISSACSSGAHAIGEAVRAIRHGVCDQMIAGGAEAVICPMAVAGFSAMKALSTRNQQPTMASRPFDRDRDGFVIAEGAAALMLESYESAARRNAPILCEISGYGLSADAYHEALPHPEGRSAAACMRMALADSGVAPETVDYINAHGTATPSGDGVETTALKSVFRDHAQKLWISSTKSMTGHLLGAAGAIESMFTALAVHDNAVPPTINLDHPSEDCDLDYVPVSARDGKIRHALNNSFGFGGTNACLVFSKVD
jgi:3-oxoacyl-[acyl-carrier-protein] synthase II